MNDIKNKIVEFSGEINDSNVKSLENSISVIQKRDPKEKSGDILISVKKMIHKGDLKALSTFIGVLVKNDNKIGWSISCIDYTLELFALLKSLIEPTRIRLFKNLDVANLFLNPKSFGKSMSVLLYDDDVSISKKIFLELMEFNHKATIAKNMDEFLSGMKSEKYDAVVTRTTLNEYNNKPAPKPTLSLSKQVIVNLPIFMNKAVETLVSFTGMKAEKISHTIQEFDLNIKEGNICSVMAFHGGLEGYFTLIFPKDIAILALESLLGDTVDENDLDTLQDGVREFCNIITGATKTEFDSKDIKVLYELPQTFNSLEETKEYIGFNSGVWMNMELSGKAFYIFITK